MYKEILLAVDLVHLETQTRAIETVIEYAKAFGSRLHCVTVVPDFGYSLVGSFFPADFEHKVMEKARADLHAFTAEKIPSEIAVQHIIGHGSAYQEILRAAEEISADLIVMASHRPEVEDYMIGPNAARVVRHAKCSVLVVRG